LLASLWSSGVRKDEYGCSPSAGLSVIDIADRSALPST
jgi:hypothetical protein